MISRRIAAIAIGVLVAGNSFAHPSSVPHPHNADTVEWQINWFPDLFIGMPDGNAAHNHRTARSFGGYPQEFRPPYNAYACWDDIATRVSYLVKFDKGHCFINEFNPATPVPTYSFENAGSMPGEAKHRIRDAFDEYSNIPSIHTGELVGIEFEETDDGFQDIEVLWAIDPGGPFYGAYDAFNRHLIFDASVDWSYEKDKNDVPAGKWHFYSVALHEVGHVVGLAHQSDSDDVMTPIVGGPANAGGRQFDHLDIDTIAGIYDLYSQPVSPPPQVGAYREFAGCNGLISEWTFEFWTFPLFETADTYRLERAYGSSYISEYEGPADFRFVEVSGSAENFRLQGENSWGIGDWTLFTVSNPCGDRPPGNPPPHPH